MLPDRIEILRWLYSNLKPKRFLHTLGVEQEALELAMIHGLPLREASVAALLHDCAKNLPEREMLRILESHQDPYTDKAFPQVLHAFAGPYVAEDQFGPLPEDIANAIRFHTTGRSAMSPLEKLIFSADYTEPGREEFAGLAEARALIRKDLSLGTAHIIRNNVYYLQRKGALIHPLTLTALTDLSNGV